MLHWISLQTAKMKFTGSISLLLTLLAASVATAAPSPPKCSPPALVPLRKCIGGTFKSCAAGLIPIPLHPPNLCHAKRHRLVGCITECADSPRIAIPTCPPYQCETPTAPTLPPGPTSTGKACYDTCYAASSCVSDPPLEACKCNAGIISSCSVKCGIPVPPIAPCIEPPTPEPTPTSDTCYKKCRDAIKCPTSPFPAVCECNNRAVATCSVKCGLPLPPLPPCPVEEVPGPVQTMPVLDPGIGDGTGGDCKRRCKELMACPMAWPMSCYCEVGQRRTCAQCYGLPWDEEKEIAPCKNDFSVA